MPTSPSAPARDERMHWRHQHDDLQAIERQVQRLADHVARLADLIEGFAVARLVESQPTTPEPAVAERQPRMLSVDDLAEHLGVPKGTVYHWRTKGFGPKGIRMGRRVKFPIEAVEAWVEQQRAEKELFPNGRPDRVRDAPTRRRPGLAERCPERDTYPIRLSQYQGRGVCGTCKDDVILKRNGRLAVHWM